MKTLYMNHFQAHEALKNGPHAFDGEIVDVAITKSLVSRLNQLAEIRAQQANRESCSLFIGFVPENVTEESLTEVFSKFGEVSCELVTLPQILRPIPLKATSRFKNHQILFLQY